MDEAPEPLLQFEEHCNSAGHSKRAQRQGDRGREVGRRKETGVLLILLQTKINPALLVLGAVIGIDATFGGLVSALRGTNESTSFK